MPYEKIGDNEPICIADEVPFEIPESWEWVRLGEISYHVGNKYNKILSKNVKLSGKIPVVSQGAEIIDGYCENYEKAINDLPLIMFGDHTRNVKYIDFPFVIAADGTKFHKIIISHPKYIFYWMLYAAVIMNKRGYARHYSLLTQMYIPLPPLAEQKRIVEALEALQPYIDEYEAKETALSKLNADFPDLLKKSILQQAVMGKLVPQDENDEPAAVLLERIRAEKEALIKAGKLKKSKHESIIYRRDNSHYEKIDGVERCIDDEIPFEIPENWAWCRLGTCLDVRDGTHDTPKFITQGLPLITSKNLVNGRIDMNNVKYISKEDHAAISIRSKVDKNDILFAMIGSIGNPVLFNGNEEFSIKNLALFKNINNELFMNYVYYWLFLSQEGMKKQATGGVQSFVSLNYLRNYPIPLPPLAEQKRIVDRINMLMEQCKQLKQ